MPSFARLPLFLLIIISTLSITPAARAVPSFARQTGLQCAACHQSGNFPELTSFGRQFKLGGYTMATIKDIESGKVNGADSGLSLIHIPLFSAMLQASATHTNKDQSGVQNNSVNFPQQLSLFMAGRITPQIGTFIQSTYGQGDSGFSLDLADIRYANNTTVSGKSLDYGVTFNNMPTLEDPWNSSPVWSFPWSGSDQAPGPQATTMLDGDVLGDVAGLGTYGFLNDHWYADVSLYRSSGTNTAATSSSPGSENVIQGVAPYWRFAYEHVLGDANVMLGTFGMDADLYPSGISGPTDHYRDLAVDTQIEKPLLGNMLTVHGSYINEERDPSAGDSVTYDHYKVDGNYHVANKIRTTLGYSTIDTGSDNLDTTDWIAQLAYYPWQNVNLSLQYTGYTKFDGDSRHASDNDTTYLMAWMAF